ncbi:CRISPR-associated endonuclease Cas2 [Spirulina major]|uniref:CRISPR-associated endonuclease Cas2 n=1 Tax=Spirulina major TaxID=270636 RepID=UPI0009346492|nr:CRISPR-associated endonuclease Cas2 [Spirulina major]
MLYLICYDIVQDRRRTKVANLLGAYGLRIQKSVFEAVLPPTDYERLEARLLRLLDLDTDQLRFYPLGKRQRSQTKVLGIQPDYAIDDPAIVV